MSINIDSQLPSAFRPLFHPSRYKAYRGGRGGAKSRSFATALVIKSTQQTHLILCCREFQNSIKESVYRVLKKAIQRLEIEDDFTFTNTTIINKDTGSEFIFMGLFNNADNVKSTEGVTICWIEEAHAVSQTSIDVLFPTIREENSEIWASWNPKYETDPIHKKFVVDEAPPDSLVVEVGFDDNPWFPQVLRDQMEFDRQHDNDKYRHVWLGECVVHSEAQVLDGCWEAVDETPTPPENVVQRWGLDFGFSVDPSACIRSWISGRTLYIDRESYGRKVELDFLPEFMKEADECISNWPVIADSSRPDTISYLNNNGMSVVGSKKGKGSINDGVQRLRSYRIVINQKECPNTVEEAKRYSYKVDKATGMILPIIEDNWNHCLDAIRYSLEGTDNILVFNGVAERDIKESHESLDSVPGWWNIIGSIRYAGDGDDVVAVLIAINPDTNESYLIRFFRAGVLSSPTALWVILKSWGENIRWVSTGIGLNDKTSKENLDDQMRHAGFAMYHDQDKDQVESGTSIVLEKMLLGKFKADENVSEFWHVFRTYCRKDGRIVTSKQFSIMDAVRAAMINEKFASPLHDMNSSAYEEPAMLQDW